MTVANAVRQLRKAYGLSQQAFATQLGLSIGSIANYELGSRVPDVARSIRLYQAAKAKKQRQLAEVFKARLSEPYREFIKE